MISKEKIFTDIQMYLDQAGLAVSKTDMERPWGGFFVIEEKESEKFIEHFFPELNKSEFLKGKLSPKMLLVAPHKKLSWQYHYRRSEVWKLVQGEAAVVTSDTDIENETTILKTGEIITLQKGERHRLVGLNEWGIVAEIWVHTDESNPSDEEDIVRLQDDYGR